MYSRIENNTSQEDYLEAILRVFLEKGYCRSVDVAERLSVAKPSVSTAMKKLLERELITMDGSKFITLTEEGRVQAEEIFSRHMAFKRWLMEAGVEESVAEEEACSLEHAISEDSFEKVFRQYVTKE